MATKRLKQAASRKVRNATSNGPARPPDDKMLRKQLVELLRGENAHVSFEKAIAGIPAESYGTRHPGQPFTLWQILEHLRIAQWDILEFSRSSKHVSPEFPKGYWPDGESPPESQSWDESVKAFGSNLKSMTRLVANPRTDLHARLPWGTGQTVLREALVLADHNAYHIGQLVLLRRLLGVWSTD